MIDPDPGADRLRKGAVLIRKHFGEDPWKLDKNEFADRLVAALWLERNEAEKLMKANEAALMKVASLIFSKKK